MSGAQHTPGPWMPTRSPGLHDGAHDYAISAKGAPVLSEAFGRGALGEWLPAEANARLIAAAPDLLKALERADRELDDEACVNRVSRARAIIQAAIAKAEGRS